MEFSKFMLGGLVLIICAFIFQLIGMASPYWILMKASGTDIHAGLWDVCIRSRILNQSLTQCPGYGVIFDWLKGVRATSILGCISLLGALVLTILKMFVMKDKKPILFAAVGTAFVGALSILISIAVFAAKFNDAFPNFTNNYHFAYAFCIIGMLAALGAGIVMIVNALRTA